MEFWTEFRELPYSDAVLMAGSALVTLLAVIRIVQSSFKMFFWVIFAGLGLASVAIGSGQAPWDAKIAGLQLSDVVGPGKEMSTDALELLCIKLDENRTSE